MQPDHSIYFALFWMLITNLYAYFKDFYTFDSAKLKEPIPLGLFPVLVCFGIYLTSALLIAPLLIKPLLQFVQSHYPTPSATILVSSGLQLITLLFILVLSSIYLCSYNKNIFKKIWKIPSKKTIGEDIWIGSLTWLISFPLVVVVSHYLDLFISWIFGPVQYEQTAVHFVKTSINSPLALVFAMGSVLFLAPVIEELLFRGLLQTCLKRYMNPKYAISLSAVLFALFHLTGSQGAGNLSLGISLFVLGGYLGFLYEKQASLFAPIGLHVTFNAISALRIIIFPE